MSTFSVVHESKFDKIDKIKSLREMKKIDKKSLDKSWVVRMKIVFVFCSVFEIKNK